MAVFVVVLLMLLGGGLMAAGVVAYFRKQMGKPEVVIIQRGNTNISLTGSTAAYVILIGAMLVAIGAWAGITAKTSTRDVVREARNSLGIALDAGLADYAPQRMDELKAALDALREEGEKSSFFRSSDRIEGLAEDFEYALKRATQEAAIVRAEARVHAEANIASLRSALEEARSLLQAAPRGKGTAADLEMMMADLAGAESTLVEAEGSLNTGMFKDAQAKSDAALSTVTNTKTAVEMAIAAKMRKK
jgi:hypothetical protein